MKPILWIGGLALLLAACAAQGQSNRCDQARFIEHVILDVPVQEGTLVMPGTHFTKTWRLQNSSPCDWNDGYVLAHTAGEDFAGQAEVMLPALAAGETADISLRLTAPDAAGSYEGEWMLRSPTGALFGVGPEGGNPLRASLRVAELPGRVVYDFLQVICLTRWDSGRATFLPCEGEDSELGIVEGYVRVNTDAALEGSTRSNPPVLEMKPNNQDGWIAGYFPPITLAAGDRFAATVGCLDGNPECRLLFILEVELVNGSRIRLLEWAEEFDDVSHEVVVDLSELAGEEVRLILMLEENDGRSLQARGFWLNPRVERTP
ncbi:MAG: hypothetical protein KIS85_07140 [Anaerolineales bacterium]|nr:hypothetical protein [Anaerolineales bacterium]